MKRAQQASTVDPFAAARVQFEEMLRRVGGRKGPEHHAEIEDAIELAGREVHRLVLQGRLDQMFAAEAVRFRKRRPSGRIRERERGLESRFGRVVVRRHGVRRAGETTSRFPLDERLGLPKEMYSLGLRRLIAEETRVQSWEQAVARVDTTTGGHVPKRQAEELVARAAQDFDDYYAERLWSETANDTATAETLLVMSCDGKGIAMRPEALREATRKQAEQASRDESRGDRGAKEAPAHQEDGHRDGGVGPGALRARCRRHRVQAPRRGRGGGSGVAAAEARARRRKRREEPGRSRR